MFNLKLSEEDFGNLLGILIKFQLDTQAKIRLNSNFWEEETLDDLSKELIKSSNLQSKILEQYHDYLNERKLKL